MENKEKYIIDSVKSHREEVDIDSLWASLDGKIPQPQKRKRGVFWWANLNGETLKSFKVGKLLLLCLVGLLIGYWTINIDAPLSKARKTNSALKTDKNDIKSESAPIVKAEVANKLNRITNKQIQNEDVIANRYNKDVIKEAIKESRSNNIRVEKKYSYQSINDNTQTIKNKIIESDYSGNQNPKVEIPKVSTLPKYNTVAKEKTNYSDQRSNVDIKFLKHKALDFSRFHSSTLLNTPSLSVSNIKYPVHQKRPKFEVFVLGSTSLISRSLDAKDVEQNPEVLYRDRVEKAKVGWSTTVGLSYQLTSDFRVSTGLEYEQYHEQAKFEATYIVDGGGQELSSTTYFQDGSSSINSSQALVERKTNEVRNNNIRFLNIPFSLDYRLYSFGAIDFNVSGHFAYSIYQGAKGYTSYMSNQSSYDLSLDKDGRYARFGAMKYGLGFNLQNQFSKNVVGVLGIRYTQTGGINSEQYMINQKYNSITFSIGLHHKL